MKSLYGYPDHGELYNSFESLWGEVEIHLGEEVWILEFKDGGSATLHPMGTNNPSYAMTIDPSFSLALLKHIIDETGNSDAQFYRAGNSGNVLSD